MLTNIDIKKLKELIKEGNLYVFDFRDKEEFRENRLKGAINLNISNVDEILRIVPNKENKIVVYCAKGVRSLAAGERLVELGYKNVYNLYKGIGG
ncbi:MAG: rhodanese-like domain-containing protein [Clostridia bacterium]|nr:rhodanese-like domain-containing protein [Clostridia bacterium]